MKGLGYRYKEAGGDRGGGKVEGKKEREGMGYEMGGTEVERGQRREVDEVLQRRKR